MKRRVAFLWWHNPNKKSPFRVLTIQKKALENIGCEAKIFDINTVFKEKDELIDLNSCDLVFTSVLPLVMGLHLRGVDTEKYDQIKAPVLFQIDGYGGTTFNDKGCNPFFHKITERVDLVTFLDMNVYEEFKKSRQPFEYDKIFFIPNGTEDLLQKYTANEFKEPDEILIGTLTKENYYKKPWVFLEATKQITKKYPSARIIFPVQTWKNLSHLSQYFWPINFGEIVEKKIVTSGLRCAHLSALPNVDFIQYLPYRKVPNFVASCDVFCHYSHGDIFGKTLTEAFSLAKAPITGDIIRAQGISLSKMDVMKDQIGRPIKEVYEATEHLFSSGDREHYLQVPANDPTQYAETVSWAIEHPIDYAVMGLTARAWSSQWLTWEEKWKHTFDLCEERGIL